MAQRSVLVSPQVHHKHLHSLTTPQITGANGHLGFRALVSALSAGYAVRAIVRREAAAEQIKAAKSIQPYLHQIQIMIIQDLLKERAFDEAVVGMDYVLHIASPVSRPVSHINLL
jgi:nucleoside-diphosphate-sugar epimerase